MAFNSRNTVTGDFLRVSNKAVIKDLEITGSIQLAKLNTIFGDVTYAPKVLDAVDSGSTVNQFEDTSTTHTATKGELYYVRPYLIWDPSHAKLKTQNGYFIVIGASGVLSFTGAQGSEKVQSL
ncbi:MAG: hypothetical protein CMB64_03965 [Euryarchaeota archaeon]|nr:hypothetical protein [Euryarchaeota archaeon]